MRLRSRIWPEVRTFSVRVRAMTGSHEWIREDAIASHPDGRDPDDPLFDYINIIAGL